MRTWIVLGSVTVGLAIALLAVLLGYIGAAGKEQRSTTFRREVGAQTARHVVTLDGVEIGYTDTESTGPVLICIHAIGYGSRDFEDLSRRLGREYRVIALDLPGQGTSGTDSFPASAKRYEQLLSAFIEALQLRDVVLLGNSIGGATSIRYAVSHSARVRGIVLCDPGGIGKPSAASKIFIAGFVQFFAAGRRGAFWFPRAFAAYYHHVLITPPSQEERARIIRSAYEIAPVLEQAWRSFGSTEENLTQALPRIQCPVLFAWAKNDGVVPLRRNEPYFHLVPDYQLEVFEGGHAAFLEDPASFEASLRRFLAKASSRM